MTKSSPNTISRDLKASSLKVSMKSPGKASKELKKAVCSICMEFPHNSARLLCSSYGKGCYPYMCATGDRFSNCLEQYEKAYTRSSSDLTLSENSVLLEQTAEKKEPLCPLCRGEVKGWAVEDPARKYFNSKQRICIHDQCSFVGDYKQLKNHVKLVHSMDPSPRDVDPKHLEEWHNRENEREHNDFLSTIQSIVRMRFIRYSRSEHQLKTETSRTLSRYFRRYTPIWRGTPGFLRFRRWNI